VRVVTRPAEEFGGGGTAEVADLVRGLRALGVAVDLRARMHEKVAILDGRVLWHGSLNILSHRDTSESMLRLESPVACQQLARFLSPPAGRREDQSPAFDTAANPECPQCGGPTVWNDDRHRIWFECEASGCGGKVEARRGRSRRAAGGGTGGGRTSGAAAAAGGTCPEPGCGGTLRQRNGRFGPFLGCSNYPRCRHTENLDTETRARSL